MLQRVASSYFFAACVYPLAGGRWRPIAVVASAILLAYWALFSFVSVPGTGVTSHAEGANWANYIEQQYLPGRRWEGEWDPEGLLSGATAVASCLLGVLAGLALKSPSMSCATRATRLSWPAGPSWWPQDTSEAFNSP